MLHPHYEDISSDSKPLEEKDTVVDDDGTLYEIIIDPDEAGKPDADDDIEEYELLEVDIVDPNENEEQIDSIPITSEEQKNIVETTESQPGCSNRLRSKTTSMKEIEGNRRSSRLKQSTVEKITVHDSKKRKSVEKPHGSKKKSLPINIKTEEYLEYDDDDDGEGESGDEFPARNSDDEDWPSQMTLDEFPKKIIRNGLLLIKGKQLMSMICRFYNLECKQCKKKNRFK